MGWREGGGGTALKLIQFLVLEGKLIDVSIGVEKVVACVCATSRKKVLFSPQVSQALVVDNHKFQYVQTVSLLLLHPQGGGGPPFPSFLLKKWVVNDIFFFFFFFVVTIKTIKCCRAVWCQLITLLWPLCEHVADWKNWREKSKLAIARHSHEPSPQQWGSSLLASYHHLREEEASTRRVACVI